MKCPSTNVAPEGHRIKCWHDVGHRGRHFAGNLGWDDKGVLAPVSGPGSPLWAAFEKAGIPDYRRPK